MQDKPTPTSLTGVQPGVRAKPSSRRTGRWYYEQLAPARYDDPVPPAENSAIGSAPPTESNP